MIEDWNLSGRVELVDLSMGLSLVRVVEGVQSSIFVYVGGLGY